MDYDVILAGGTVHDGSGADGCRADVAISGDRIERVGHLADCTASQRIDVSGCIVSPGFIDTHSHSDVYLLIEPSAASKVHQGITTEICGNCGASAAPLNGEYKMPSDWMAQLESLEESDNALPAWRSVAEYRTLYDTIQPAINAALLIGHNTLHAGICGYEPRAGTSEELQEMVRTLEQAMDDGAIGLSSGLAYPPGSAVEKEELIALARMVAKYDGRYTTHMRSESDQLLESIDEAIDTARQAGVALQISHLKASGKSNWSKLETALEKIRAAATELPIGSDRYPYTAGSTDLDIVLPAWATYGGRAAILTRLRTPEIREKIRAELMQSPADRWNHVMVGSTKFEAFKGAYLPDVAEELGLHAVDALLYLIDEDDLKTGGVFFGLSEENTWRVLAEPYVSIGSDGSMRAPWGPLSTDHPHPRAYGSHTRFLRAALDGKTVPLPEAIYKMTGLPAEQFGLKDRGLLKEGYAADLIVFDPGEVEEKTTYADPHQLSEGMMHVFVNGVHTLEAGRLKDQRGGSFLARQ